MEGIIETINLTKVFGSIVAVDNLNLVVKENETFGFLGPNGAGKTTTIKMLTGFLKPTSGEVKVLGYDMFKNGKEAKEHIGLVPDQYGFYNELTAVEHLNYYAALYGIPKTERRERIDEMLDLVELTERKESKVKEYSHGMRQRLVIAQALINKPKLLLLDEPTVGLDPRGSYMTRKLIKKLAVQGLTIFVSSHLLFEVEDMCTWVGIIDKGKLIRVDSIKRLSEELREKVGIYALIECVELNNDIINAVKNLRGVRDVSVDKNTLKIDVDSSGIIPDISTAIMQSGGKIKKVNEHIPNLEEIFLKLTEG